MKNLTKLALKRPVSALLIVLALFVFGIGSVFGFRMELIPDVEMPMLIVMTVYQGGDPETTMELVTKVIEDAGKTLSGVKSVDSGSNVNYSYVMFRYEYGTDISEAYSDLRAAIDGARLKLPEDAMEPTIIEMNMNAQDMMTLSVTSTGDMDVLAFVEDELELKLDRMSEIAQVTISGGKEEYISVELHKDKLLQYGITMANIGTYIATTDFTIPIGNIEQGSQNISSSASSKPENLIDLQNIPIVTSRGTVIKLSDIATVTKATKANDSKSRFNGNDSISIGIAKAQSAGTVDVSNKVKQLVKEASEKNSEIQITVAYDAADGIKSSLSSVAETLVLGVVFSMLVLFIFFGDIKASLIVGSSMPISLLATLIFMSFAGFSLNVVTMGALVIAIGMMVDSSIVVLESCFRLKDKNPDFKDAAYLGTSAVGNSVTASTITTVVVYLPLARMNGLSGQLFSELGYTIIFAMLSSLIVALTLIPIFFWKYKPVEKKNMKINTALQKVGNGYRKLIGKIIMKKKTVMLVAITLLGISVFLVTLLNTELMAQTGLDNVKISIEQRSGTKLDIIDERVTFIEKMIIEDPDFIACNMTISGNKATITAVPSPESSLNVKGLVEKYNTILKDVTNMNIIIEASGNSMASQLTVGAVTEIDLEGDNMDDLKTAVRQVESIMLNVPGVIKTSSDITSSGYQAKVKIDPLKCMDAGLSAVQVASEMYSATTGKEIMDLTMNKKEYSVILEYPRGSYSTAADLMNLELFTPRGTMITVADVADIEYTDVPKSLTRADGKYQVAVKAYTTEETKYSAKKTIVNAVENEVFPEGVAKADSIMEEMMNEEFYSIGLAIAIAVFLIFLVMAMQFESPSFSLMVMLSIPFSLIGSFFLLFISGSTLDMTALMGILMLAGIVVNNGILYVDTANQLKESMTLNEALIESGSLRLRPILMTTLTTILSMVPMIFTKNENAAMMKGMSLIIIGGLITSTLLILLLLPSFYLLMSKQGRAEGREYKKMLKMQKMKKNNKKEDEND